MHDDGDHSDGGAGDGVFGAVFILEEAGTYAVEVQVDKELRKGAGIVSGNQEEEEQVIRSSQHVVPVLPPLFDFSDSPAFSWWLHSPPRLRVAVPLDPLGKNGGHDMNSDRTDDMNSDRLLNGVFRAHVQVWGTGRHSGESANVHAMKIDE